MNRRTRVLITLILFAVVLIGTSIIFDFGLIKFFEDDLTDKLFCGTMSRAIISLLAIYVIRTTYGERAFRISNGGLRGLMWAIPCILVAFANFPYSALISGNATITRMDVLYLYIFFTIATGIYEELIFRGFVVLAIKSLFLRNPHKNLFTILISSALFAVLHAFNFMYGFDPSIFLQVGYTFLLGCMLGTIYLYTKNIYLCIGIHAVFNFGGMIVTTLGTGNGWDMIFWIVTAVCGIFCTVHIVFTVIKLDRNENQNYVA